MSDTRSSYRSIMKATSIFGGVQVFNILITLVRAKLIAILIGAAGMGLNGIFMSGLNLIKTASSLGLSEGAVKDLSGTYDKEGDDFAMRYSIFRYWIWITAILGASISILFAPLFSKFTFGDYSYSSSYVWLSVTFIFGALSGGIYTVLRATRRITDLAKANIYGSISGLLVTLPILYFFGIDGVLPSIIASAFTSYLVSLAFRKKIVIPKVDMTFKEAFHKGKPMAYLGLTLSFNSLMRAGAAYLLIMVISRGSLADVGMYNAGMSILDGYVGMVFTAMATDYFPRLASVIQDKQKWAQVVNHQAELVILIIGPILTFLMASLPILIRILLSKDFLEIIDFLMWCAIAVLFRSIVWVLGFIMIAKGENKLFLKTESIIRVMFFCLNVFFYLTYGLEGLGISMLVGFFISSLIEIWIIKKRYDFTLNNTVVILTLYFLGLLTLNLVFILIFGFPVAYYSGAVTVLIAAAISLVKLNKILDLKDLFASIKNKTKSKK